MADFDKNAEKTLSFDEKYKDMLKDFVGPRDEKSLRASIVDAEQAVIGSMLIDPDCIPGVLAEISAQDFLIAQNREIFAKIAEMTRDGVPVDGVTVAESLGMEKMGRDYLAQLMEITPTSANVLGYIDLVKKSVLLYRLRTLGSMLIQSPDLDDAVRLVEWAENLLAGRSGVTAYSYRNLLERFLDRHSVEPSDFRPDYLIWPLAQLNEKIKSEPGNIIVLGAYPGDGKTAFALQCAAKFAEKGKKIGYFLFESNPDALFERHIARELKIAPDRIRNNTLTEDDWEALTAFTMSLNQKAINIDIIPASGMTAQDIVTFSLNKKYSLIFVDYIQLVDGKSGGKYQREYERVTEVSQTLQRFAARSGVTVFALSQFSRPDKGYKRTPTMSDLRASGQIEQDADVVLLMWRETYELTDSPRIIQIAKNRYGESMGKIKCHFDGKHQEFTRMAGDFQDFYQSRNNQDNKKPGTNQVSFDELFEDDDDGDMPF